MDRFAVTAPIDRPVDAPESLRPGRLVGPYVVERHLSSGGCGAVYEARHSVLGRSVALKLLHPHLAANPRNVDRFLLEARTVNKIGHANIVDIVHFDRLEDGTPYHVMELIRGASLDKVVDEVGPLGREETMRIARPVLDALEAAHAAGIVHRDLKPSNILVALAAPWVAKLTDFGIAKLLEPEEGTGLTTRGRKLGTPIVMAPEQILAQVVDERTDVYAMGVVLFFMVTGRYPFVASTVDEVERLHLDARPPAASAARPQASWIDDVVGRCLEKTPALRHASVRDLRTALERAAREEPRADAGLTLAVQLRFAPAADDVDGWEQQTRLVDALEEDLARAGFVRALRTDDTLVSIAPTGGEAAAFDRRAIETAVEDAIRRILEDGGRALAARLTVHAVSAVAPDDAIAEILRTAADWSGDRPLPELNRTRGFIEHAH